MPPRDVAYLPGQAAARTQHIAQRAGGAWNRHDTAAVRANIGLAIEIGSPRLRIEYGGLKILYQLVDDLGIPLGGVAKVVVEGFSGDVLMDDDLTAVAGGPSSAAATHPLPLPEVQPTNAAADDAVAAVAAVAIAAAKVAATATARRRRQKQARKERDQAARLLAAQPGVPIGDDAASRVVVHVPLWSTTMGQSAAMVRLLGEVTERCAVEGGKRGVSTRAISIIYGGRAYSAAVLQGTVATCMTASKCGEELLALLSGGLTEEGISILLRRWSQTAATSSSSSSCLT